MTGKGLRVWRDGRGLSQVEAAKVLGVSERTLRGWEALPVLPVWVEERQKAAEAAIAGLPVAASEPAESGRPAAVPVVLPASEMAGSYVPLLEASIIEELRNLIRGIGEQVGELKEAVDILRHRVKAAEDEIVELRAELGSRPREYVGESAKGNGEAKGGGGLPKPRA